MAAGRPNRAALLSLTFVASGGVVVLRLLGTRWPRGRRFDVSAVRDGLTQLAAPRAAHATAFVLETISISSLALAGGGLITFALLRRRADIAAACAVVLAGAPATSELLKRHLHPINSEASAAASFPSGHATVALAVGLSLTMVVPRSVRVPAAIAASLYAFVIGSALVVAGAHLPSDVAAGFCVATAWAAGAALLIRRPVDLSFPLRPALGMALVVAAAAATAVVSHPGIAIRAQLHPRLAEAVVGIAAAALACVAAFAGSLRRAGRDERDEPFASSLRRSGRGRAARRA